MKYKILGKTKLRLSEIGLGTVQLPRITEKQAIDLIKESYNRGINFFDTAYAYRNSEIILGKALEKIRDKVIISTKSLSTEKKVFLNDLETSLKNLRTDYIDIYLFHDVSKPEKFEKLVSNKIIDALLKEQKKGKVRSIGFSCHNPQIIEEFYGIDQFQVLMIPLNFISTEFTEKKIYKNLLIIISEYSE